MTISRNFFGIFLDYKAMLPVTDDDNVISSSRVQNQSNLRNDNRCDLYSPGNDGLFKGASRTRSTNKIPGSGKKDEAETCASCGLHGVLSACFYMFQLVFYDMSTERRRVVVGVSNTILLDDSLKIITCTR